MVVKDTHGHKKGREAFFVVSTREPPTRRVPRRTYTFYLKRGKKEEQEGEKRTNKTTSMRLVLQSLWIPNSRKAILPLVTMMVGWAVTCQAFSTPSSSVSTTTSTSKDNNKDWIAEQFQSNHAVVQGPTHVLMYDTTLRGE